MRLLQQERRQWEHHGRSGQLPAMKSTKCARPVVLSVNAKWERDLHIVVPLRGWQRRFESNNYFWIVKLSPDGINKLKGDSGADTFQVKSVSRERFRYKVGVLSPDQLQLIVDTVAFCIGYTPPISDNF